MSCPPDRGSGSKKRMLLLLTALLTCCCAPAAPANQQGSRFYGIIEKLPKGGGSGLWIIDGRKVIVSATTKISEPPEQKAAVGHYVEVRGEHAGQGFLADLIAVKAGAVRKDVNFAEAEKTDSHSLQERFYGIIEKVPKGSRPGLWIIDGRKVIVSATTKISEPPEQKAETGHYVEVWGKHGGQGFFADLIAVKADNLRRHLRYYGPVEAMPPGRRDGVWRIGGREFLLTKRTRITEKFKIGSLVEVKGDLGVDNIFTVYEMTEKSKIYYQNARPNPAPRRR